MIAILILCYLVRLRKLQSPIQHWATENRVTLLSQKNESFIELQTKLKLEATFIRGRRIRLQNFWAVSTIERMIVVDENHRQKSLTMKKSN